MMMMMLNGAVSLSKRKRMKQQVTQQQQQQQRQRKHQQRRSCELCCCLCCRKKKRRLLLWWLLPTLIMLLVGVYTILITSAFFTTLELDEENNKSNNHVEARMLFWQQPFPPPPPTTTTTTKIVPNNNNNKTTTTILTEKQSLSNFRSTTDQQQTKLKEKKVDDGCWLDPPWGWFDDSGGADQNNNEVVVSGGRPTNNNNIFCASRNKTTNKMIRPYTDAKTLTCINSSNNNNKFNHNHNENENHHLDPDKITIILLYYSDPSGLQKQLENYKTFPKHLLEKMILLIVDDGSPVGLQARDCMLSNNNKYYDDIMEIRIVRITTNIPWNMCGGQNLGFYLTTTTKVLLLDVDTTIPYQTFQQLLTYPLYNAKYTNIIKKFFLVDRLNRTVIHSKLMFLKRDTYWMVGGCDEDFSGHYGHDDTHFFRKCKANHPNCYVAGSMRYTEPQDRLFLTMLDEDPVTTTNDNDVEPIKKQEEGIGGTTTTEIISFPPKDPSINKKLLDEKLRNYCWSNQYLRFPWTIDI